MRKRIYFLLLGLSIAALILPRILPKPTLQNYFSYSRSVFSSEGKLLRMTLAADEQYRVWTPIQEISPVLQASFLCYEDRWFYWHPGFNPWSLMRGFYSSNMGTRRMGGSTLSMQLARRIYDIDSRTVRGKAWQIAAAVWLELRYSKRDIFEAYLNSIPFGANIEGVGAASQIYFHHSARDINLPEAINLAVIPQNPRKRMPRTAEHLRARNNLAQQWLHRYPNDKQRLSARALEPAFYTRADLPFLAPHLSDYLLQSRAELQINTSLNLRMQSLLERVLHAYIASRANVGINNASALLVDVRSMQVKAMVGSANYNDAAIAGQVNGIFAKRSPGSTLKPFIYGLALDQGLIHSASILKDAPTSFGAFAPENFDGRFSGPLPATDALIRSRNIPAVYLASRLSQPSLYDFLKLAGVQKMASAAHYGLALVLGGGEVTMEEQAQLYATLANQGRWRALNFLAQPENKSSPIPLLSAEAAFITLDMLRQTPRPDTYAPAQPKIAWKTGTSWGFRDAWTAGVFGPYVLVVWVGNFDGASNPALVGIEVAAPLFLRIVDGLRNEKLLHGTLDLPDPSRLQRVEICNASGDLPNAECPARSQAWFIAGVSPLRQSTLHRKVWIDQRTGQVACAPNAHTRAEVFEFWPSDMRALFQKAGMQLRVPPTAQCGQMQMADTAPRIVTPVAGVAHIKRLNNPEPILLRADAASSAALNWFADNALLGQSMPGEVLNWIPPHDGRYAIRVVDANGLADSRELVVELMK